MVKYVDAHMHLGLMDVPGEYIQRAVASKVGLFSNTVEPQEYERLRVELSEAEGVRLGLGLHPWWIDSDGWQQQLNAVMEALPDVLWVGEVGLDFSAAHEETADAQLEVLRAVLHACAASGEKVISLHCVRAYDQLLDLLASTGVCRNNVCIIHWFSGTHEHLLRARSLGCWFSVGERLLSSKRGRAYVRSMPSDRLLLETDAPPEGGGIQAAYSLLAAELGEESAARTTANGCQLFGWE